MLSLLSNANVVTDVPLYVRNLLVHGGIVTIAFKPRLLTQSCLVKKQQSSVLTTT
jgi:hypothetical protein